MPQCIQCKAYTRYEKGLCLDCYHEKNNASANTGGMNDREYTYRYNMIKGRIAETLIQELFLSLGYNVFRYGMENTIPAIMTLLKGVKTEVASEIKSMPDFVIQNPRNNEVYFVEVKFRASGVLTIHDIPDNYAWGNAYFILVSKKHIKCITYDELLNGEEITPNSQNYLGNRREFNLDRDTIIDFCSFALTFFQGV